MDSIQRINASLSSAKRKTRIEPSSGGGFLRIRYSEGGKLKRISAHIPNTAEGLREAERLAITISSQLELGRLDPSEWNAKARKPSALTYRDLIARVRVWFFRNREETPTTLHSWSNEHMAIYKRLDPEAEFNGEELLELVRSYRAKSRQRHRAGSALGRLAKEAGAYDLSRDLKEAGRGYSAGSSESTRYIPEDSEVIRFIDGLEDENWRWVLGVTFTFGLRPHEAAHSSLMDDPRLLRVGANTKTGARIAMARKSEWIDRWNLRQKRLPLELMLRDRPNGVIGEKIGRFLIKEKAGWTGYSLRHRYALSMITTGVKSDIIARSMGHSLAMHFSQYQRHISERELGAIAATFG